MRGNKLFELTNHLGNVLETISDKKIQHTSDNSMVDYYLADVLGANDYYSFGMQMPGRGYAAGSANSYRYGFNGKEQDPEVKGPGDQYDYGMRMYDPRTARFLSADPLKKKYPYFSPYQFSANSPIKFIDLDGLEPANNPKTPGANEKRAMEEVAAINIETKQTNTEVNVISPGWWKTDDQDLKGSISCGPCGGYITDTKGDPDNKFNMKVFNGATLNVDESQAKDFMNYEAFVVNQLVSNFVSGKGSENYNFPTNGIISSKFLKSDILKDALEKFQTGEVKPGVEYQAHFGGKELSNDFLRTGTLFSSITGFVGSGTITIKKTDNNMLMITILNITSW